MTFTLAEIGLLKHAIAKQISHHKTTAENAEKRDPDERFDGMSRNDFIMLHKEAERNYESLFARFK